MKKLLMRSAIVVFALCFISVGAVQASELTFGFPSIGSFYFSATGGSGFVTNNGPLPYMWTAGDFVTQTFFGGPAVADSIAFTIVVADALNGYDQTVDFYINGILEANIFIGDNHGVNQVFVVPVAFPFSAPINGGGTYNYSYVLENTIPAGGGSIAFYATPEPSSIALLGSGVLGLAGVLRRKFRV
jgi:hypothetical protein